jgi:hypothetical protein
MKTLTLTLSLFNQPKKEKTPGQGSELDVFFVGEKKTVIMETVDE